MFNSIVVERKSDTKIVTYQFSLIDINLILETYTVVRKEGRKKILETQFHRIVTRHNDLKEEDVILPQDVKEEALKKFIERIKVCKWNERFL